MSKNISIKTKKQIIIHPFLFAIFPVLFLFSNNLNQVEVQEIIFPSIIYVSVAFVAWIIIGIILKTRKKSAFIVTLSLVLFFSYGHILNLFEETLKQEETGIIHMDQILMILYGIIFVIGIYFLLKTKSTLSNATTIANVIVIAMISILFVNIVSYGITNEISSSTDLINAPNVVIFDVTYKPDIYYIILDGYGREDILRRYYNYDNSNFINSLTERGFIVPSNSHSNYFSTLLSISSTLGMEYVNYLTERVGIDSRNYIHLFNIVQNSTSFQNFKANGYTIININSVHGWLNNLEIADFNVCGKNDDFTNREFIIMLARTSALNPVYADLFNLTLIDHIICQFEEIPQIRQRVEGPIFVFAHIVTPHPPYIFGPNGEHRNPDEHDLEDWNDKEGYINQLQFANKMVLKIIDEIKINSEREPVIIIHADHGPAYSIDWFNPDESMIRERASILNAYYLPNSKVKPYETITPVNTFRLIFNGYFNGTYDLLDDRTYYSHDKRPYDFDDVTDMLLTENGI